MHTLTHPYEVPQSECTTPPPPSATLSISSASPLLCTPPTDVICLLPPSAPQTSSLSRLHEESNSNTSIPWPPHQAHCCADHGQHTPIPLCIQLTTPNGDTSIRPPLRSTITLPCNIRMSSHRR
uniref:Uncharacterized protein n=1 Tax=Echinococcus granulosus TaxID=6210 RepID=A0A068X4P6_ECHGR|nr:hypothetical protein EgrG_002050000 [Echinococcus granulosus]